MLVHLLVGNGFPLRCLCGSDGSKPGWRPKSGCLGLVRQKGSARSRSGWLAWAILSKSPNEQLPFLPRVQARLLAFFIGWCVEPSNGVFFSPWLLAIPALPMVDIGQQSQGRSMIGKHFGSAGFAKDCSCFPCMLVDTAWSMSCFLLC